MYLGLCRSMIKIEIMYCYFSEAIYMRNVIDLLNIDTA